MTQPDPFTQSRVLAEVARHGRVPRRAAPVEQTRLTADLGYDSRASFSAASHSGGQGRVSLAMELEEAFHLAISDDDCAAWCTVGDVIRTVAALRANKGTDNQDAPTVSRLRSFQPEICHGSLKKIA